MRRSLWVVAALISILAMAGCNAPIIPPSTAAAGTSTPAPVAQITPAPTATAVAVPMPSPTSGQPATATQPPSPAATVSPRTPAAAVNTFTSQSLGISFNYAVEQGGNAVKTMESGDKVYVYLANMAPTSGQWVQVFSKNPGETLQQAIQRQVLKGYSVQDCPVAAAQNPEPGQYVPPTYSFATIDLRKSANDDMPALVARAAKCPQPYAAVGGLAYFLADSSHPDKFLFFSIGQYAIEAAPGRTWQSTIKFLGAGAGATAQPAPATPTATPAAGAAQTGIGGTPAYLDDRSTPQSLMQSFVNALNRKEYARAYGYWNSPAGSPAGPPPFAEFQQGYADTASVGLAIGTISGGVGAGQLYWSVPVTLIAQTTAGATQTFVGCYTLHLARPELQTVPPFHPLGIESASVRQVANNADTTALMAQACQPGGETPPALSTGTASPADISAASYLDNRSGPVEVLRSLFNAINRKEYARGYSYWRAPAGSAGGPPPFAEFQQGYADTAAVELTTGVVSADAGAGQRYFKVPVTLTARTTDGKTRQYAGCYTLHLASPQVQAAPPFQPLGIESAVVQTVPAGTNPADLMNQICR